MAGPITKKSKASRFPAARIKKIMQMDEDVGKLASATPVMISKSLECFMQLLLDESAKEARSRGSKKLTAYHLKHTINNTPSFDFLLDIVSRIPDPTTSDPMEGSAGPSSAGGPSKRKPSSSGPTGAGAPRGRKKKVVPATGEGEEELRGMEDVKPDTTTTMDESEQVEYHGRGNIRPGMSDLLNPSEPEPEVKPGGVGEKEGEGETGGRGMFDDYEDDDDY